MATTSKARTDSGIAPYAGLWDRSAILHLLRRVHFGVVKDDIDYYLSKTLTQSVDDILNIDYTPPAPPINNYNDRNTDPNVPAGSTWVNDYNASLNGTRRQSYQMWWSGQIINHDRSIREQMVLFWHNHFATQTDVVGWANFCYQNNATLRKSCLKNFKTLVKDITLDPAMLIFLNGERNTASAPDENYSRELQELFTLGKSLDSQYTESDVISGAKVLTGWRINKQDGTVYFQENRHDTNDKQFSAYYNNKIIAGKTGPTAGEEELDEMLAMIFAQNEVAKFIVRKLYRWFVYYDIDEATENNVITPLANIFRDNDYEIKPVLEALFRSEHFYDVANRGALIKSPASFTHGLIRTYDIVMPQSTEYVTQYSAWGSISNFSRLLQQELGDPPSVSGWPAYYQLPQYHELWINSDTLPNRNRITDILTTNGYNYNGYSLKIDAVSFAEKFDSVSDPNLFIKDLLEFLHTLPAEDAQLTYMKSILLSGQLEDHYWSDAWNAYINDRNNDAKRTVVSQRLSFLLKYLMNLGEFQLS